MKEQELHDRIFRYVKSKLLRRMPVLAEICNRMKVQACENPFGLEFSLATDGKNIIYCVSYVDRLYRERKLEQLEKEWQHILVHGLLGHFEKWSEYSDNELFNFCADLEVKRFLTDPDRIGRSRKRSVSERIGSLTKLYAKCQGRLERIHAPVSCLWDQYDLKETDDHSYWQRTLENGVSNHKAGRGMDGQDGEEEQQDILWQENSVTEENVDFKSVLKELLELKKVYQEDFYDKGLYSYGFDTYGDVALIEPLEENEEEEERSLVIAIDTSGSCQGKVVKHFLDELKRLFQDMQMYRWIQEVILIQCDYCIRDETQYDSVNQFLQSSGITLYGFEGTDFRPVFERVEELNCQKQIAGLIYFTDGMGIYPDKPAGFKTIFLLEDGNHQPDEMPDWIKAYTI